MENLLNIVATRVWGKSKRSLLEVPVPSIWVKKGQTSQVRTEGTELLLKGGVSSLPLFWHSKICSGKLYMTSHDKGEV